MAQAIRAILFARAQAASLSGLRSSNLVSQGERAFPLRLASAITAIAPTTGKCLMPSYPSREMPPIRTFPPGDFGFGVNPTQLAKWRPSLNCAGSTWSAKVKDSKRPTPGSYPVPGWWCFVCAVCSTPRRERQGDLVVLVNSMSAENILRSVTGYTFPAPWVVPHRRARNPGDHDADRRKRGQMPKHALRPKNPGGPPKDANDPSCCKHPSSRIHTRSRSRPFPARKIPRPGRRVGKPAPASRLVERVVPRYNAIGSGPYPTNRSRGGVSGRTWETKPSWCSRSGGRPRAKAAAAQSSTKPGLPAI